MTYELIQADQVLNLLRLQRVKRLYPRLAPTCEWDTAAAQAILEGAGGSVKEINGEDFKYGKINVLTIFYSKSNFIHLWDTALIIIEK